MKRRSPTRWSACYECVKHLVTGLDGIIAALERLIADPFNKDTQTDAHSLLTSLENFEVIALLEFWVQVLAPVDRCHKIFQDPRCSVVTAADALKMLGERFIEKREGLIEDAINKATSWCERKEIPMEKRCRKKEKNAW